MEYKNIKIAFNKKMKFKNSNKPLIDGFRVLRGILFDAKDCYELWWGYIKTKNEKEYLYVFLEYKKFFETLGFSVITSLVINLYKLYDPRKDVYSVGNLIQDIETLNLLTDSEKKTIEQSQAEAVKIWKKVLKLRHKLFAHRSADLTVEQVYALAKITPNEFRDMTKYTLNILNGIAPKIYEAEKKFCREVRKDSLNLVKLLKNSIKRTLPSPCPDN